MNDQQQNTPQNKNEKFEKGILVLGYTLINFITLLALAYILPIFIDNKTGDDLRLAGPVLFGFLVGPLVALLVSFLTLVKFKQSKGLKVIILLGTYFGLIALLVVQYWQAANIA